MTLNEKVAERMGWEYDDFLMHMWACEPMYYAKLIQQKLVDEGWTIDIRAFRNGSFEVSAILPHSLSPDSERKHYGAHALEEPAAIFSLACKCWGMGELA